VHPEFTSYAPERAEVGVKLKGGGTLTHRIDVAKGHPLDPLSMDELVDKFSSCAGVALPASRLAEIADLILNLSSLPDVRVLAKALCP
jgi:2-methylcitrate dehydratase PrpD